MLTGANGFLGKVILSSLAYHYPDFAGVHVLIRPRGDRTPEQRFEEEVLSSPAMEPALMRTDDWPALRRKIHVWGGDASLPNAGFDEATIAELRGRVGVILNCAGLVEFFPPVDQSVKANVDSVERLVELAKALDARIVHVSTCYVAGRADGLIEETDEIAGFYPERRGPEDSSFDAAAEIARLREAIAGIREQDLPEAQRERRLVRLGAEFSSRWGWVNTYTYSKSLGEQLLAAQDEVPYAIVRPAIVESALRYPTPGWIEGGRTAAPLVLMALGGLKDWPVRPDIPLEVVPVDLIAGATLAVTGALVQGEARHVYHLASQDVNPFELKPLVELLADEAREAGEESQFPRWLEPLSRLRFLDETQLRERKAEIREKLKKGEQRLDKAGRFLEKARLPGGAALRRKASNLRMLSLQANFREEVLDQYLPFVLENRYIFEAHNIRETFARLDAEDQGRVTWDPQAIDWRRYWRRNQIEGIRRWVQPEAVRDWSFQI